jgi:hypothetical protein
MKSYIDEEHSRSPWLTILGAGTALYAAVMVLLLFIAVGDLKEQVAGRVDMAIGPLSLFHIQKVAEHGGNFSLEFSLSSGLALLCIACYAIAGLGTLLARMLRRAASRH